MPRAKDSELARTLLQRYGFVTECCRTLSAFEREWGRGAAAAILTEEVLDWETIRKLSRTFEAQPAWSDFPLIVLLDAEESASWNLQIYDNLLPLGNFTLLERPVRVATLLTSVKTAVRARSRQYQVRDHLAERQAKQEELARSNADLQQFAYVTSHDLKEPLRTITAYSQLLEQRYDAQLDDSAKEFLHFIIDAARRMGVLIQDLLEYSRVINAEEPGIGIVQLDGTLQWALMNLTTSIRDAGAQITYDPLPNVRGNQIQIVQLFQNLIGNAIKYRAPGRVPEIHISAAEDNADRWIIAVRDNGLGIEPQYRSAIFGLFKRLHGRDIPGTGVGLAICQKIVERHGGRLWLESESGVGSTFYFTLAAA